MAGRIREFIKSVKSKWVEASQRRAKKKRNEKRQGKEKLNLEGKRKEKEKSTH